MSRSIVRSSDDSGDFIATGGSPVMRRPRKLPGAHPQFGSPPRSGAARSGPGELPAAHPQFGSSPRFGAARCEQSRGDAQSVRERPSLLNSPGHSLRPGLADVPPKSDLWTGEQVNEMFGSGDGAPVCNEMLTALPAATLIRSLAFGKQPRLRSPCVRTAIDRRRTEKNRDIFGDFDKDLTADCADIDETAKNGQVILQLRDVLQLMLDDHIAMVNNVSARLDSRPEWHKRILRPILDEAKLETEIDEDHEDEDVGENTLDNEDASTQQEDDGGNTN